MEERFFKGCLKVSWGGIRNIDVDLKLIKLQ